MYPNPTSDYVILATTTSIVVPLQLKIEDALGSIVMSGEINMSSGSYTISAASFASGVYYIALYNSFDKLFSDKLTIIRR